MAKRETVKTILAPALEKSEDGMEVIVRGLTPHRMVPTVGRGQRAAHYNVDHIKNVLLGVSSPSPGQSGEAVLALDGLVATRPNALLANREILLTATPGTLFGEWIKTRIGVLAADKERRDFILKAAASSPPSLRIEMSPETPWAFVSELCQDGNYSMSSFLPDPALFPLVPRHTRRIVEIDEYVIAVAAELLADTLAQQAPLVPGTPPKGGNARNADPDKKKAAGPGSPSDLRSSRPSRNRVKTALLNKVQSMEKEGTGQPFSAGSRSNSLAGAVFTNERNSLWHASALPALPSGSPPTQASRRPPIAASGTQR